MTHDPPVTIRRIPSLDGLRAIAIVCVVAHHLMGAAGTPAAISSVARHLELGPLGVRLFFVISGFLITTLLRDEYSRTGAISLKRFYVRRSLRIFPPFYFYVAVIALLEAGGFVTTRPGNYFHALTYTMNFGSGEGWYLGHAWSLSIEEQFYFIWPALLLLAGVRRAPPGLIAVIVIVPLLRAAAALGWFTAFSVDGQSFAGVADWLAGGALLAFWRDAMHARPRYLQWISHWVTPLLLIPLILAAWTAFDHWRVSAATSSIALIGIILLVDAAVTQPAGGVGRLLNTSPLIFIGRISYSLYIWQELFCNRASTAWPAAFPMNVVLSVACATGAYYLIERPSHRAARALSARL